MSTVLRHPSRPPPRLIPQRLPCSHYFHVLPIKWPSQKIVAFCSSSSLGDSFSILTEEPSPPSEVTASPGLDLPYEIENNTNSRGCKTCGREEIERGCNGEGRIQGGIATVPGFGWWPIKAFRPCPGFVASGGRYRRRGQSMDEVAFGRTERSIYVKLSDKAKSSKKNQGPRKLNG